MKELANFIRIKRFDETAKTEAEYWYIRGKLLNYELEFIQALPEGQEPVPGKHFQEGIIEIGFFHISENIWLWEPADFGSVYDKAKPGDMLYFCMYCHSRPSLSPLKEKFFLKTANFPPEQRKISGEILEFITSNEQILVDTGIPIYCWQYPIKDKFKFPLSVGDWVTAGMQLRVSSLKPEEIPDEKIVAMTDDFRSFYDKK